MKTIEQYEVEIAQKNAIINEMMSSFSVNIDRFNDILGKDPQYVYNTLDKQWKKTITEYQTTTLRNQKILQTWSNKLDAIISVLNEVMSILKDMDNIAFSSQESSIINASSQSTSVQDLAEKASEQFDNIVNTVQEKIENAGISGVKISWTRGIIVAGATYALLSILRVRPEIKTFASFISVFIATKKSS
jgi:hypothetical protein